MTSELLIRRIGADQVGLVLRQQATLAGLTPSQWRTGAAGLLAPVLPGVKRLIVEPPPKRAVLRRQRSCAATMVSGKGAAACLGAGLRVHGIAGTPEGLSEDVWLPSKGLHQRRGIARHWFVLDPAHHVKVGGVFAVEALASLMAVAAAYDDAQFLSVLDSALHLAKIDKSDLAQLRTRLPARRSVIQLADGRRESPLESRTALMMAGDAIRDVEPQVPIFVPGFGNVRVDFKIGKTVIVEADGAEAHDDITTRYADRKRHEALERLGYIVVRVTWADVVFAPRETLARIRSALIDAEMRARGWVPPAVAAG